MEFRLNLEDGTQRWIYLRGQGLSDSQGQARQWVGVVMDITERKCAQEDIRTGLARIEVQHRLLEQREQERLKIAHDLHDGPVQDLLGAMYALQGMLSDDEASNLTDGLRGVAETLQHQVAELRDYAGELRPPALAKFGLGVAIRSHLDGFREKHPEIRVEFINQQEGELIPEEKRLALFRIYQEGMANILKHSQATEVKILVSKNDELAVLVVQDNGRGFGIPRDWLELARNKHFGLVGMRERVEAVGGKLEIDSQPGKGTLIRVEVPL